MSITYQLRQCQWSLNSLKTAFDTALKTNQYYRSAALEVCRVIFYGTDELLTLINIFEQTLIHNGEPQGDGPVLLTNAINILRNKIGTTLELISSSRM
jgi:hypothetical protein